MLDGMRAASQNWIGRTIMGLLMGVIVLSFAIWGIGDIFKGIGTNKIASVGSAEIATESYRNAYQIELQRLQRRAQRVITNDEARQIGLDRQVLGRMVSEAALDQKAKDLGLAMSDAQAAKLIADDPSFKDATGRFDKMRFDAALRDNGYNERGFVREQKATYLRQAIAEAIAGKVTAPRALSEAIHRYNNETRSVDYFILPPPDAATIAAPAADVLQKFYDERRTSFRAPEYRKIVTLELTPASISKPADVSDADAMKLYEQVKGQRFGTAETRDMQQIVFPTTAEAQQAADQIKGGAQFEDVATARKLSKKDIDIGSVTRGSVADAAIAAAAFALPEGGVSAPVAGSFGTVLVKVTKINPESVRPFVDVASELKSELALQRAAKSVQTLHDTIEDQRASGKTLTEGAKAAGLEARMIDAVDAAGRDPAGKEVTGLTAAADLLKAAFASDIGVDNETVSTRDNGYVWFEVAGIDPARQKSLEEARDAVLAAWRDEELQRALTEKASAMVKRIDDGEPVAKVANEAAVEIKTASSIKRGGGDGMEPTAIAQIFNQPNGGTGSAAVTRGRLVFHVNDSAVSEYNPDSDENKKLAEQIGPAVSEGILSEFIARMELDAGVRLNEAAFRAATGGAQQ